MVRKLLSSAWWLRALVVTQHALALALLIGVAGCGKVIDPLPPEAYAPQAVDSFEVTPTEGGILFSWSTPGQDRRKKELESIDGYSVERKELVDRGDETNPDVLFEQLAYIPDTSIKVREEERLKAREEGKIGRKIKGPETLRQFTFLDPSPEIGRRYLYQVVPLNQGGVEGVIKKIVKVVYEGEKSDVSLLDAENLEDEADDGAKNKGRGGKP